MHGAETHGRTGPRQNHVEVAVPPDREVSRRGWVQQPDHDGVAVGGAVVEPARVGCRRSGRRHGWARPGRQLGRGGGRRLGRVGGRVRGRVGCPGVRRGVCRGIPSRRRGWVGGGVRGRVLSRVLSRVCRGIPSRRCGGVGGRGRRWACGRVAGRVAGRLQGTWGPGWGCHRHRGGRKERRQEGWPRGRRARRGGGC